MYIYIYTYTHIYPCLFHILYIYIDIHKYLYMYIYIYMGVRHISVSKKYCFRPFEKQGNEPTKMSHMIDTKG